MRVYAQNWLMETRHLSSEARAGYVDLAAACSSDKNRGRLIDKRLIDGIAQTPKQGQKIVDELLAQDLLQKEWDGTVAFRCIEETPRWLTLGAHHWWGSCPILAIRPYGRDDSTPIRVPVSAAMRAAVLERDGFVCGICGDEIEDDLHIDHIRPVSRGGETVLDNLQPAHARCNLSKGARMEEAEDAS